MSTCTEKKMRNVRETTFREKLQNIFLEVAGGQEHGFRQMFQHLGKQTRLWKHHTSPQQDEPTRWQLVSCYNHWKRFTKNMWSQPSPTLSQTPGRLVHRSGLRKRNRCSSYGSLSCSGSFYHRAYTCLCDLSSLASSRCSLHPVIDKAFTLVFHCWPLPLCTADISSPPWYDYSVSFASTHM